MRQKELVKAPEDATAVNALQKHDVPPKRQMEAAQSVSQKLPEPANLADPAEQKKAKLLDEFTEFSVAAGIRNVDFADLLLTQMNAMQLWGPAEDKIDRTREAVLALREMDPKNATEALLAVQMFGVHNTAMLFLKRATVEGQTFEGAEANALRATRLMRLFNEQLDAMAKLKGKAGLPKVTFEHVHVHKGGQAIVGTVAATGPRLGVGDGTENRKSTP